MDSRHSLWVRRGGSSQHGTQAAPWGKSVAPVGAVIGCAVILLLLPAVGSAQSESDELRQRRAMAADLVDEARSQLTFEMLMPAWLPAGYSLEHIAWFGRDADLSHEASSVDAWYSAPGAPLIHVWQTDNPDLGDKDPVMVGAQQDLSGRIWSVATDMRTLDSARATMVSTRWPDGTTLSLDGGLPSDVLLRVAGTMTAELTGEGGR